MSKNPFVTNCLLVASVGLTLLICSPQLHAQTSTWIGGGADTNWSTAANWQGGALPFPGAGLLFQGSGTGSFLMPNNSAAGFSVSSLGFGAGTGNFTVSGQQISLGSGGISSTRSGTSTITADVALAPSGSPQSWTLASGSTVELDGVLSGTTPLTLAGSGTLVLGGNNTYAGTVGVSGGTLRLTNSNALASAFFSGGTLSYGTLTSVSIGGIGSGGTLSTQNDSNAAVTVSVGGNNFDSFFSGTFSGTGILNKVGTGNLTLSNSSSTAAITLSAGTLTAQSPTALGSGTFTINGGTFSLANSTSLALGGLAGTGTLALDTPFHQAFALTVGGNNASTTFSGSLTSSFTNASLTKVGAGTLTLSGSNPFIGSVSVSSGTLQLANANALSGAGYSPGAGTLSFGTLTAVNLGGIGGSGNLSTQNDSNAAVTVSVGGNNLDSFFSGTFTGTGTLNKVGTGNLTLSNPGSTSAITLSAGTLTAQSSTALGSGTLTFNGGRLSVPNSNSLSLGGLAGSGTLSLDGPSNQAIALTVGFNNASTTFSGSLTNTLPGASLNKVGTGTLTLSGSNPFTGSVSVSSGTLMLANPDALAGPTYVSGAGTLSFSTLTAVNLGGINDFSGSFNFKTQNDNNDPVVVSIGANNQSTSFFSTFTGSGTIVKVGSGSLTLGNSNSTAAITLSAGTIIAQSSTALGSGTFTINGGRLLVPNGNSLTLGGLAGSGTLSLDGPSNQAVALTVGFNNTSTAFSGSLTNTLPGASLTKIGTGTLTLSGSNRFTGSVSVSSGTLKLANTDALAGPTYIPGAGTLSYGTLSQVNLGGINGSGTLGTQNDNGDPVEVSVGANNQSTTFSGTLTGTGTLIKTGAGSLSFSTGPTSTGIELDSGTLLIGSSTGLGNGMFTMVGGTLSLANINSLALGGLAGSGNLALVNTSNQPIALTVGFNNASTTFSGSLTGSGSLDKVGTGTLTLAAANTFTGTAVVNGGILRLADPNALGAAVYTSSSGTLSFGTLTAVNLGAISNSSSSLPFNTQNANNDPVVVSVGTNNQNTPFLSAFTGSGTIVKVGTGTLTLGNSNSTAAITLSAGTLTAQSSTALGSGTFTINGGTLTLANGNALTLGGLAGSGALSLDGPFNQAIALTVGGNNTSTTFSGSLTNTFPGASLNKVGTGTLTLSGSNPFSGSVSVSSGTLKLANADALAGPTYVPGAGTLSFGTLTTVNLGGISDSTGTFNFKTQNDNGDPVVVSVGGNNQNTSFLSTFTGSGTIMKVGSGNLTLSNSNSTAAITLSSGTITAQSVNALGSGTFTINGGTISIPIGNSLALGGLAGSGAFALVTTSNAPAFLSVGGNNASTTFSGSLTGPGSLDKTGTGTLILSSANTFTGSVVVDNGTLRLADPNALGGAVYFPGSGTLSFGTLSAVNLGGITGSGELVTRNDNGDPVNISVGGNNGSTSFFAIVDGPGTFEKVGSGTLAFSGATSTSDIRLTAGTLSISAFNALGSGTLVANGGSLTVTSDTALLLGGLAGPGNIAFTNSSSQPLTVTVGGNNASTTFSGRMSGAGAFTKIGTGTLTLSGASTFSGVVSANDGTIALGDSATLSQATFQTNANPAELSFGTLSSASLGAVTGTGTIDTQNTLSDPVDLTVGGTDANFTFAGALTGPGSLIKTGFGTLTLSGSSNTAAITLNSGAIAITQGSALGTGTFTINNSASLSFGSLTAASAGSISGNGSVALRNSSNSPVTLTVGANNASTTFSGHFSGVGSLQKAGSGFLTLTGGSTHSGGTLVSGGALLVENSTGSALGSGSVTTSTGSTLGGNGSFTGPLSLSGLVSPGIPAAGPGTLSVGATTLHSGSSYLWEIGDASGTPGTGWDLLSISGTLNLGSLSTQSFTLQIQSLNGVSPGFAASWDPSADHTWIFASATGIASFNSADFVVDASGFLNPVGRNSSWSISQVGNNLQLNYAAIPEPAATGAALGGFLLLVVALARRRRC